MPTPPDPFLKVKRSVTLTLVFSPLLTKKTGILFTKDIISRLYFAFLTHFILGHLLHKIVSSGDPVWNGKRPGFFCTLAIKNGQLVIFKNLILTCHLSETCCSNNSHPLSKRVGLSKGAHRPEQIGPVMSSLFLCHKNLPCNSTHSTSKLMRSIDKRPPDRWIVR